MNMPVRSFEAQVQDDPRNALLDAFAATIEALIENGLEPQLRARFRDLLPSATPERDLFAAPSAGDANSKLELSILIGDCQKLERKPMSSISHQAILRMKARAQSELEAISKTGAAHAA